MFFPAQWSDVIENADEPVSLIAKLPDCVVLALLSLNPLVTRDPPGAMLKS
jgi:hypothetical protein